MSIFPNDQLLSPVYSLCRFGDVHGLEELLMSKPELTSIEDPIHKWNPLHCAAYFGQVPCMQRIITRNPGSVHAQAAGSFLTPLHCAATAGKFDAICCLLGAGADANVKDSEGEIALHKAARSGNVMSINVLLHVTKNVCSQNNSGQTASAVAQFTGYQQIAMHLRNAEKRGSGERVFGRGRKRTMDAVCDDDISKRFRPEDGKADYEELSRLMHSSVVEHTNMYDLDMGYTNTLLECMLSEYHGC
ncbi:hypothetical protein JTE90_019055 [Oedothorax gibbosus]|uniref:Ankyrin repeat domain-containing protein 10 n=1 Tax=Oedothorax gibbosus TaxID=931172 RepID=A0AAV6UY39_9ARAC|nr:hypothetical protein JTE90_019055 [Oedothorax gibbosus]